MGILYGNKIASLLLKIRVFKYCSLFSYQLFREGCVLLLLLF